MMVPIKVPLSINYEFTRDIFNKYTIFELHFNKEVWTMALAVPFYTQGLGLQVSAFTIELIVRDELNQLYIRRFQTDGNQLLPVC